MLNVDGRSGSAGADAVVASADDGAVEGAVVDDMLAEERSAPEPAPAPARSQGLGGEGIATTEGWSIRGKKDVPERSLL